MKLVLAKLILTLFPFKYRELLQNTVCGEGIINIQFGVNEAQQEKPWESSLEEAVDTERENRSSDLSL